MSNQFLDDLQASIARGELRVVSAEEWERQRREDEIAARVVEAAADKVLAAAYDYDVARLEAQITSRLIGGWGQERIPALRRALAIADARRAK